MTALLTPTLSKRSLARYLELLRVLVERNLSVRYRGSLLGIFWSLLNPMVMTLVYTGIFGATFTKDYNNSVVNYVLAVFTGSVVIQFFSASTSQALTSIVGNGGLLNKVKLPMSIFPVSIITANLFQFAIAVLPLLVGITLIRSKSLLNVLALFIPLTSLVLVCIGIGFLVSTLYVFFRDLPYFYELICFFLFIGTPIFYPASIIKGRAEFILKINPIAPIIENIRQISLFGQPPDFATSLETLLVGAIFLGIGWAWFRLRRLDFMDLL